MMMSNDKPYTQVVRALPFSTALLLALALAVIAVDIQAAEPRQAAEQQSVEQQKAGKQTIELTAIIIAFVTPVIGAVVAGIARSTGTAGKIKDIEYLLKRLELIEKLHAAKKMRESSEESKELEWIALETELDHILEYVRDTSEVKAREGIRSDYAKQKWPVRVFILPKPITIAGWIATVIYYLYAVSALTYLLFLFTGMEDPEFANVAPFGFIGSVILALLARLWALHSFRKAVKEQE